MRPTLEGSRNETSYGFDYTDELPSTSRVASTTGGSLPSRAPGSRSNKNFAKKSTSHGPQGRLAPQQRPRNEKTNIETRANRRKQKPISTNDIRNLRFINEVRKLCEQKGFLIPKLAFGRVIRELMFKVADGRVMHITAEALEALQVSAETFMTQKLSDAYHLTLHRKCVTLAVKDIKLLETLKLLS